MREEAEVEFSYLLEEVQANVPIEINLNRPDTSLQKISMKITEDVPLAEIKFKILVKPPEGVFSPERKVLEYIVIEYAEIDNTQIEKVTLDFKVEKAWLEENAADVTDVVLTKFTDNAWEDLTTRFIRSDDTHHYFEADSDGLSVFAVTLKGTKAITEETEETEGGPLRGVFPQTPIPSIPKWFTYAIIGAALIGLLLPRKKVRHRRRRKKEDVEK